MNGIGERPLGKTGLSPFGSAQNRIPKVLVLSRSFPNNIFDTLGLWVERPVRYSVVYCEPKVIAPVPYFPPVPGFPQFTRFRNVHREQWIDNIEVLHPRFFTGPGYLLYEFESASYYLALRHLVHQLHKRFPFDLIHAHFVYPDGVTAGRIAERYGVPYVITEHAPWLGWMDKYPRVRRQAVEASRRAAFHITVSTSGMSSVQHFTGETTNVRVIPNSVDGSIFRLPEPGIKPDPNQVLFIGAVRFVKGLDVLVRAVRLIVDSGKPIKLLVVGEAFYCGYQNHFEQVKTLVRDLGLQASIEFVGKKLGTELVRHIHQSSVLVLPSRAESFGIVLVEALACGTPVVATRCGGPEDIVNERVGLLVPPEDPAALASAILEVLRNRANYDPRALRQYALENFGLEVIGDRIAELYRLALERSQRARTQSSGE